MVPVVHILLKNRNRIGLNSEAGPLLMVGGNLDSNNSLVYEELVKLAGGKECAKIGVITAANKRPQYWGHYYVDILER